MLYAIYALEVIHKWGEMFNLIKDYSYHFHHHWLNRDNEENMRISSMISEFIHHRDSFHPWLLEHHECSVIINAYVLQHDIS